MMRIYDEEHERPLFRLTLFLTTNELRELAGYVEDLMKEPKTQHVHLTDEDYRHEITVAVYDSKDLSSFDSKSKRIILEEGGPAT